MENATPDEALRRIRPEPAVFVLSVDSDEKPSGMIAGWYTRLSYEPPLIGVLLSVKRHTHSLIRQSKEFVVAVPDKGLEKTVRFFGSTHGNEVDKFKETGIATVPATQIKTPLLKDASINLECKLENEIEIGDHVLFVGRVVEAHVDKEKKILMNMGKRNGAYIFEDFLPIQE